MSDSELRCPKCGLPVEPTDDVCFWCCTKLVPQELSEPPSPLPPPGPAVPPPPSPLAARDADAAARVEGNWWDRQVLAGPEWAYWLFVLLLGLLAVVFLTLVYFLASTPEAKQRAARLLVFGAALIVICPLMSLLISLVRFLAQVGGGPTP